MKNIFKIHPITYLILVSVLLAGYFNYFLIVAFILIFHDLGHILMIKLTGYKITNILVLPFGSIINTNINQNTSSWQIFLISIAGVLMQIILYPIANIFFNDISYYIFLKYNLILLLFNLLPIIPLDGSKIIQSLLEIISNYRKSLLLINIISFVSIIFFLFYLGFKALNSWLIITFLIYKTYEAIVNHHYLFQKFLLDRYLYKRDIKRVKYIKSLNKIYKNKYNFINNNNEEKVLSHYFKR